VVLASDDAGKADASGLSTFGSVQAVTATLAPMHIQE
jgi:hypothetical protein